MKKCKIIMNPQSGRKKNTNYKAFYDILRKYDYDCEIIFTKAPKHAISIVENLPSDVNLVIAAGGDGTLNEVVTGNMRRKKPLTFAALPLGTINDVGNMIGLTNDVLKNLELILSGVSKNVDICYINDTPFVYVSALGNYIDMVYSTPRDLKARYGKLGYIYYGLKQIITNKINNYEIEYIVDGKKYKGNYSFFFITNSSRIAGVNDVYYDIKLNDNMFEVAFAKVNNKKEMFRMFVMINTRNVKDIPGVKYYRTNEIKIKFLSKLKTSWCIDGEEYKTNSMEFTLKVVKGPKMLLPRKNIKKLFD